MDYNEYSKVKSSLRGRLFDYTIYELIDYYFSYILDMFVSRSVYENVPEGFDTEAFEDILYLQGECVVVTSEGKLYALPFGYEYETGPYSAVPYHERFLRTGVSSAYLGDFNAKEGHDILMCHNTQSSRSFKPIFLKSAVNLAHIDKSIQVFAVNSRLHGIFSASDAKEVKKIETFYDNLIEGKYGTIVNDVPVIPDIVYTELPTRSQSELNSLIIARNNELRYICRLAGISMDKDKNQAVLSNESEDDYDFLAHNADIIIEARHKAVDDINRVFGTSMKYRPASKEEAINNIEERRIKDDANKSDGMQENNEETSDAERDV